MNFHSWLNQLSFLLSCFSNMPAQKHSTLHSPLLLFPTSLSHTTSLFCSHTQGFAPHHTHQHLTPFIHPTLRLHIIPPLANLFTIYSFLHQQLLLSWVHSDSTLNVKIQISHCFTSTYSKSHTLNIQGHNGTRFQSHFCWNHLLTTLPKLYDTLYCLKENFALSQHTPSPYSRRTIRIAFTWSRSTHWATLLTSTRIPEPLHSNSNTNSNFQSHTALRILQHSYPLWFF